MRRLAPVVSLVLVTGACGGGTSSAPATDADPIDDASTIDAADATSGADSSSVAPDGDAMDEAGDAADAADGAGADATLSPEAIFGSRYWNVYRPAFFASFYQSGHVTDRIQGGTPMFGDGTIWEANLLSTMAYEYQAAHLDDSLRVMSEILAAYEEQDGLFGDPIDGYVYRSDRGPDYDANWLTVAGVCPPTSGLCIKQCYGLRDDEPSGDQMFATLRALRDLLEVPGPLTYGGVDLKQKARERAALLGLYLKSVRFQMTNKCGDPVKRGPDQRWGAWTFEQAASLLSGQPLGTFQTSWDLSGVAIGADQHHDVSKWFVGGCWSFSSTCVGGQSIVVAGIPVSVSCNEFNMDLGGDAAVMSLSEDPTSPDWFSNWVATSDVVSEGNALDALYAREKFHNPDPQLAAVARAFLDAPATPPTGDNHDPNGWCESWRWAHDFSDPNRCSTATAGLRFTGLDYMLPRAMASAFGEFPE